MGDSGHNDIAQQCLVHPWDVLCLGKHPVNLTQLPHLLVQKYGVIQVQDDGLHTVRDPVDGPSEK